MKNQAVALTHTLEGHIKRALYLNNLATALILRFNRIGSIDGLNQAISVDDVDRAIMMMEQTASVNTTPPSLRIHSANSASRLLTISREWDRANNVLQIGIHLLPTISPRSLRQPDRQFNISEFAGITSRAVSVSLQCGETPYRALQLSELGNGVLTSLQLQVRSDVSILKESHPELAQQFCSIRNQLDCPRDGSEHTFCSIEDV